MDNQNTTLPPMPPSDAGSLSNNYYDKFYERSSREFWKDAQIDYIKIEPMEKCKHYFLANDRGFICKHCQFGLIGQNGLTVQDGKLLYGNESVPLGG